MIPQETVNEILDAARIEEVVGDFVQLKRRGSSYVACCPFHNEKTPSFYVTPSRGIFKCFGCGKAGSAVGFLMEFEHMSYVEALKWLANKYHITVQEKEESAEDIAARQHSESLHLVSDFAFNFFKEQLKTEEGRTIGYQYFRSRGLLDETIEEFGLGWAPKAKDVFTETALKAGYKKEYMVETGLCAEWEDGTVHDRFFDRVMFPIHSRSGRVVAFGGRTLLSTKTEKIAKYVNSKESEIYVKSRTLYGLYQGRKAIGDADKCYLLEGYLDVLSMYQLGIRNVVASCGTSLTEEQVQVIKRFTENVTVMYDGDSAGLHAAVRAVGLILKAGLNARVVFLPDGDDPDSYARKHSLEEVKDYIDKNEKDGVVFKTDLLMADAGDDPLRRAGTINEIADTIADIPDAVKRQVYVDMLSARFKVDADVLFARIRNTRRKTVNEVPRRDSAPEVPPEVRTSVPYTPVPTELQPLEDNAVLAPSEREILGFILTDGTTHMEFEADSDFYAGDDPQSVAEFIDSALAADNIVFANTAYRDTYDAYFRLYDAGESQDAIVRDLVNSPDRRIATVATHLSMEKYMLSVSSFARSLTSRGSWLVQYVPRAILAYHEKRLQERFQELTKKLAVATPEQQKQIMEEMNRVSEARRKVNIKLGREKQKQRYGE
ncbi:MAG: DNA primase [Bacteroidales bacterium]|nr:DNA primase [Bacteroidales bacterium]